MTAVTCPRCGAGNRSVARFCVNCNASLPGAEARLDAPTTISADTDFFEPTQLAAPPLVRQTNHHVLPKDTLMEGFRILRTIGEGGFGIVYLAWDAALQRHVAIKEYMPAALARRADATFEVTVRTQRLRDTFDAGLKSFVNEARLLARFDHRALIKVFRFWEANRTAYMAMPYYEGRTLKQALAEMPAPPSEAQLREWLHPLLDALAVIHRENCFHRDVSPDNILLTAEGPVLLDFGAARHVITDMTQALTAVLKPGFAPIEQYGGVMLQGPWTDIYALAGVVHYAITGHPPVSAAVRVIDDTLRPLAKTHAGRYSDNFLRAMDAALAIRPEARPQDVAQFRELMDFGPASSSAFALPASATPADAVSLPQSQAQPQAAPVRRRHPPLGAWLAVFIPLVIAVGLLVWRSNEVVEQPAAAASPAPSTASSSAASAPATTSTPAAATTPQTAAVTAPVPVVPPVMAPTPAPVAAAVRSAVESTAPTAARRAERATAAATTPAASSSTAAEPEVVAARKLRDRPARCGEIIQKSSLDTLTPEEVAYLKRECR